MSDDEIEIIEKNTVTSVSGNNDVCQLCRTNLRGLSTDERDGHYEQHNSNQVITARAKRGRSKATSVIPSRQNMSPMKFKRSEENLFWNPTQETAPPNNYTPGVLSILKEALKKSQRKDATQRAVLCYERTPHIYRESFDASWGCGYRNFLVACAALMAQPYQSIYSAHLSTPSLPGLRNLQHWIEDAWEQGYDDIGARHFNRGLVNSKKKIGTGELYVAFTSRKIPCTLVDFNLRNSSKGFDTLMEWVVNHFTEKHEGDVNKILRAESPVVTTSKMPIIMQYEGHSVTIVGYELGKNGKYSLLVFDPSSKVPEDIRRAALNALTSANFASSSSVSLGKIKRRESPKSPVSKKRSRTSEDPDDGVVSIPDSDNERMDDARRAMAVKSTLDPHAVIKAFRAKDSFKKKDEYQLLYFTMGDPLSDQEQNDRKVVLSFAEC